MHARMRSCEILIREPQLGDHVGNLTQTEDGIKVDLVEGGWKCVKCFEVAQERLLGLIASCNYSNKSF